MMVVVMIKNFNNLLLDGMPIVRKIGKHSHEFRFECIERGSKERIKCSWYLHRIPPFAECLAETIPEENGVSEFGEINTGVE
jgi:hypothetical protein